MCGTIRKYKLHTYSQLQLSGRAFDCRSRGPWINSMVSPSKNSFSSLSRTDKIEFYLSRDHSLVPSQKEADELMKQWLYDPLPTAIPYNSGSNQVLSTALKTKHNTKSIPILSLKVYFLVPHRQLFLYHSGSSSETKTAPIILAERIQHNCGGMFKFFRVALTKHHEMCALQQQKCTISEFLEVHVQGVGRAVLSLKV